MKNFLTCIPLVLAAGNAAAFDWSPVAAVGLQKGGQDLVFVVDADSGDRIESIKLGGFYVIEAGARLHSFDLPVEFQLTVGDIFDYVEPTVNDHQTGKARVDRMFVEGLAFWRNGKLRLGGGASYHYKPNYNLELDSGATTDIDFKSTVAAILQADYWLTEHFNFALKATLVDYKVDKSTTGDAAPDDKMGASSLGVRLLYSL
ncbi:hypothetical protein [Pelagibaculum spongiae]|uniref:Outer membrane protein beta-barrel domain-containing protein n=1 Tax=Pelagibaculum spongiae TaxID=2080658 RepID=A0A2V1H7K2_9GAMM|nr:hypothetical protein [Pelagibaculum spongiae]PVZ72462.1 hypothetical protein DC094_05515 [Pelagibaculum spongiae]